MSYVSWEYYSSLFSKVTEEEFEQLAGRAERQLNIHTFYRVKKFASEFAEETATEFEKNTMESIKMTMCELINKICTQETSPAGNGITSVSNDGRSESYKVLSESDRKAEITSVIRNGLSGTGLAGAL